MKRRALSLATIPLLFLLSACGDQVVSPETATSPETTIDASMHGSSAAMTTSFTAPLDGDGVVPPVDTRARGLATFRLAPDGDGLGFKVNVANIDDVVGAHVHMATADENGPIVAFLFGDPLSDPVTVNGTLAEGTITEPDVIGPIAGDFSALLEAMADGRAYVQVHTSAHPTGEIRGQIVHGSGAVTTRPGRNLNLAELRRATARYQDIRAAQEDGYRQFSLHVPKMGLHYLHESAIASDMTSALDRSLDRSDPEVLVYVDDAPRSGQRRLVAAEYAIPVEEGEDTPPAEALDLFAAAGADEWHVHPSRHALGLGDGWTVHAECHYQGGMGVFLAENPDGDFVRLTPIGPAGTWGGSIEPAACPESLGGGDLPPLLIVHGKWWTLHAWAWLPNPEGVFHDTNPRVMP